MQSNGLKQLRELANEYNRKRYPNAPLHTLPVPSYKDTTANGLTKCIVDFIEFKGGRADRISSAGRFIDTSRQVTDVMGGSRRIGTGKWVPGQTRKGYADVNATIRGYSVMIEVKMKDKQSDAQVAFAEAERTAGGQYWLVHSFNEFLEQYNAFIT